MDNTNSAHAPTFVEIQTYTKYTAKDIFEFNLADNLKEGMSTEKAIHCAWFLTTDYQEYELSKEDAIKIGYEYIRTMSR